MHETARDWANEAPVWILGLLNADAAAPGFLTSSSGVNDPRRYAVYRNNVTVSLIRALEANFPAIRRPGTDSASRA